MSSSSAMAAAARTPLEAIASPDRLARDAIEAGDLRPARPVAQMVQHPIGKPGFAGRKADGGGWDRNGGEGRRISRANISA